MALSAWPIPALPIIFANLWDGADSALKRGVKVSVKNSRLCIDLHIVVTYGTNLPAISQSIIREVRYTVENTTGFSVSEINVFVDGVTAA